MSSPTMSSHLQTLNLGSFPANVLSLENSAEGLDQLIYADFQLQSIVESKSPGNILFIEKEDNQTFERLEALTEHVQAVRHSAGKSYLEHFYYSVVLAHLHYLTFDIDKSRSVMKEFRVDAAATFATKAEADFSDYLSARYYCLYGLSTREGHTIWYSYLRNIKRYGRRSQVAANAWTDCILKSVLKQLSLNRTAPVSFETVSKHPVAENPCSLLALCNYASKPEQSKYIAKDFHSKYASYLAHLLHSKTKQKGDFPNAKDVNSGAVDLTQSLYETLNDISDHRPVIQFFLPAKLSKSYLLSMTEKTYQDTCVLSNLIRTLIDLREYDEALAAFQTYAEYVDRECEQNGAASNILEVISVYALCIEKFNPLSSSIPDSRSSNKMFKYNSIAKLSECLERFAKKLLQYLQQCSEVANLSYEHPETNDLSFLYHKQNPNVVGETQLLTTVSQAWFSLGYLRYYFCVHDSPNLAIMERNRDSVLLYYKNSLIASHSSLPHLFNYALMLAHNNSVTSAQKLCKYVLKKHPECFKMWNLLVLLMTAEETNSALESSEESNSSVLENKTPKLDSERFVQDALNIAGLYILKHKESQSELSDQTRYEILQLKMTEIAVLEQAHGIDHVLELIPDVFVLYRELFQPEEVADSPKFEKASAKISTRPALYDSNGNDGSHEKTQAKDKIKSLSKAAGDKSKPKKDRAPSTASRILQELWLWAAGLYLNLGQANEAEECIVEAESTATPNVNTFTFLGYLTASARPQLASQEYERCIELFHQPQEAFNKKSYGATLLGMSQLFITENENPIFISEKDAAAGLARVKNYLEGYSCCWPYGYTKSELWYYLSLLHEKVDDSILQQRALWQCVALENHRPVRPYHVCEELAEGK